MCGIVGYIGKRQAYPVLIGGLHRLEYRGYDSAGMALLSDSDQLNVYKAKGKVSELEAVASEKDCTGTMGIAHTRWATHGGPSTKNAHPHVSESGNLTLVHNGIIENYAVLREQLQSRGMHFQSETDTEVLVQLIEYVQQSHGLSLEAAVQAALKRVIGAYAIVVLDRRTPNRLEAADGIPVEAMDYVQVDASKIKKIDINHATKAQLVRHPYIRIYRATDIWQYRHNYGPICSLDDLRRLPNFTESDIERLKPYLEFR